MLQKLLNIELPQNYQNGIIEYQESLDGLNSFDLARKGIDKKRIKKLLKLCEIERIKSFLPEFNEEEKAYAIKRINDEIEEYNSIVLWINRSLRAVFLWLKGGDNMYKEKLLSQIKILENLQEKIGIYDVSETIQLSGEILRLANKLDELEEEYTATANLDKSFEELSEDKQEKVRRFIEERFIKRN